MHKASGTPCLSWAETYREMAQEREDWSDLDTCLADGLDPHDAAHSRALIAQTHQT